MISAKGKEGMISSTRFKQGRLGYLKLLSISILAMASQRHTYSQGILTLQAVVSPQWTLTMKGEKPPQGAVCFTIKLALPCDGYAK